MQRRFSSLHFDKKGGLSTIHIVFLLYIPFHVICNGPTSRLLFCCSSQGHQMIVFGASALAAAVRINSAKPVYWIVLQLRRLQFATHVT